MMGEGEEEPYTALAEQRLGRGGLHVKLDRGFEKGTYCGYVEFESAASQVGFTAARRQAKAFAALLKGELARIGRQSLGDIEDAFRSDDPRRKRDLELTYLAFPIRTADGRYHDERMTEDFQLALLRAGQQWDQTQARADTKKHARRQEAFRVRLETLLATDAYAQLDEATKQRLLDEVPPLAFAPRGREL